MLSRKSSHFLFGTHVEMEMKNRDLERVLTRGADEKLKRMSTCYAIMVLIHGNICMRIVSEFAMNSPRRRVFCTNRRFIAWIH